MSFLKGTLRSFNQNGTIGLMETSTRISLALRPPNLEIYKSTGPVPWEEVIEKEALKQRPGKWGGVHGLTNEH